MKHRTFPPVTILIILLATACAHSQKDETPTPPALSPAAAQLFQPPLRVPLPYTFIRKGVEVRVNSVEFASDELKVSISLHATNGEPVELIASTLMEPRKLTGPVLPYKGYSLDGTLQTVRGIRLAPEQRMSVDLIYVLAPAGPGTPVGIQFTTGKWWSSDR